MSRLAAALAACALSLAAAPPGAGGAGPEERSVVVTIDDLPVVSVTPLDAAGRREVTLRLLGSLRRQGVPAVGFVNEYGLYGFAREPGPPPDPESVALLELWLDAGQELGNHTFAHASLHAGTVEAFTRDIARGEEVTAKLTKARGGRLRFFRHPYLHTGRDLATREQVDRFLEARGYRVAPVTVQNKDWLFAEAYSRAAARRDLALMRRVVDGYLDHTGGAFDHSQRLSDRLFGREIPQVLLLHANALNAAHFDDLARLLRARGYRFVPLDQALGDPAYRSPDRYFGAESIDWLWRWAITRVLETEASLLQDSPKVPAFVQAAAAGR